MLNLVLACNTSVTINDCTAGHTPWLYARSYIVRESQTKYRAVNYSGDTTVSQSGLLSGSVSSGHDVNSWCFDAPPHITPTPYMERRSLTVSGVDSSTTTQNIFRIDIGGKGVSGCSSLRGLIFFFLRATQEICSSDPAFFIFLAENPPHLTFFLWFLIF